MGGNLFQSLKRLSKEEYDVAVRLSKHLLSCTGINGVCDSSGHLSSFTICPFQFSDKDSFGDVDLYVYSLDLNCLQEIKALIRERMPAHDWVLDSSFNGDSYSFLVYSENLKTNFQLDINFLKEDVLREYEQFGISKALIHTYSEWYNYGDLSNLIGRMLQPYGLKYKPGGLYKRMHMRYDGKYKVKLTESKNDPSVFDKVDILLPIDGRMFIRNIFGDLKFKEEKPWFDKYSKEELFQKLIKSEYFKKELFSLENRDSKSKRRDGKRKMYMEFLDFIKDLDVKDQRCQDPLSCRHIVDVKEIEQYLDSVIYSIESEQSRINFIKKEFKHSDYLEFLTRQNKEELDLAYFKLTKPGYKLVLNKILDRLWTSDNEELLSKMAGEKEYVFNSALQSLSFYELENIVFGDKLSLFKSHHFGKMTVPEYIKYYEEKMKEVEL